MGSEFKVEHHYAELDDVLLHYVTAGTGPPLVLIHGWPQTWFEWVRIMPPLAEKYTVIAPDMRGLGDSSRPLSGYDKQTVARDIWQVVNGKLGHDRFLLAGHDWGGPTAYALTTQHPEAVRRLAIVDVVIPGDGGDFSQGGRRWHHQFHMTPDLPEALMQGREDVYLRWFYREFAYLPTAIGENEIQEYLRTYRQPGAMRAGFSYYRALPQDAATNREIIARMKLTMPVLAIGGAKSRGRGREPEQSLTRVATNVRGVVVPDCGHFIPEEQPEILARLLLDFFGEEA
jgi:pimeloyl-ACP methyl ester carboxylesterase